MSYNIQWLIIAGFVICYILGYFTASTKWKRRYEDTRTILRTWVTANYEKYPW